MSEYQVTQNDEVETVYRERPRPVKKRRLRGDSQKTLNETLSNSRPLAVYSEGKKTTEPKASEHSRNRKDTSHDPQADERQLLELPLFLSRDVSNVVNERDVGRNVETFIAGTLDNITRIIDDDEENALDRSKKKYEV